MKMCALVMVYVRMVFIVLYANPKFLGLYGSYLGGLRVRPGFLVRVIDVWASRSSGFLTCVSRSYRSGLDGLWVRPGFLVRVVDVWFPDRRASLFVVSAIAPPFNIKPDSRFGNCRFERFRAVSQLPCPCD